MAQYWYKKDKRIKRIGDIPTDSEVKSLEDLGYVRIKDRRDPSSLYKPKAKPKPKKKAKKKAKKK